MNRNACENKDGLNVRLGKCFLKKGGKLFS